MDVAGFRAEDKITDKEFIEALEFLVESSLFNKQIPNLTIFTSSPLYTKENRPHPDYLEPDFQ